MRASPGNTVLTVGAFTSLATARSLSAGDAFPRVPAHSERGCPLTWSVIANR
jgi:hypothetical protein